MTITSKGRELALRLTPLLNNPQLTSILADRCSRLCRTQASLHRLAEERCERELTPQEERNDERLEVLALRQLNELSELLCITPALIINGDPRGPALKISFTDPRGKGLYDCYGGEGVCVP